MSEPATPTVTWPSAVQRRWQRLRRLQAWGAERTDRALQRAHGVSLSEYLALAALAHSDDHGHLRQQALAEAIPLSQSSLSRLVARLERTGLSRRYLCETDRRGVYTEITDRGREVVAAAQATHDRALDELLAEAAAHPDFADLVTHLGGGAPPGPG